MSTFDYISTSFLILGLFFMVFAVIFPADWEGVMRSRNWRWGIFVAGPSVIVLAAIISIIGGLYE